MRVVRIGGRYLARRERQLWSGLAALGLFVLTTALALRDLRITLAVAAGATIYAFRVARRLDRVRKGRLGERLVTELLQRLPDDYCLVNDLMLGGTAGNVDHVLIGPCGVVVIETKRRAGRIRCWGDHWSVNGHRSKSFSRQVNANACAVRYFLTERHPDVAASALRWVESIVVFTDPLCRLEVHHSKTIVVRYSELLQLVLELAKRHHMSSTLVEQLTESLVGSQVAPLASRPA